MPPYIRIGPLEIAVLTGEDDEAGAPAVGSGLLLESDTGGTDFLLLENSAFSFLLLEAS